MNEAEPVKAPPRFHLFTNVQRTKLSENGSIEFPG